MMTITKHSFSNSTLTVSYTVNSIAGSYQSTRPFTVPVPASASQQIGRDMLRDPDMIDELATEVGVTVEEVQEAVVAYLAITA
jgi:predicted Rossmann fold nucleotide-binding protein DprA/Smf involved in DNA uptake